MGIQKTISVDLVHPVLAVIHESLSVMSSAQSVVFGHS